MKKKPSSDLSLSQKSKKKCQERFLPMKSIIQPSPHKKQEELQDRQQA